jgi:hypothetical protein
MFLSFKARPRSGKIQSDVPTASSLASKARGSNLMVFAEHRLKANISVPLGELCGQKNRC